MSAHLLGRKRRFIPGEGSVLNFRSEVYAWSAQVVANGGAAPSFNTMEAINSFYWGLADSGILASMKTVCCFVPDNLIAAITPLIKGSGNTPWTNHNFLSADLSVNGLLGNGTTKHLETGVIPSADGLSVTSAGLVAYASVDDSSSTQEEISCYGPANSSNFGIIVHSPGNLCAFACWRFINAGQDILVVASPGAGFYSGQRTGASAINLYYAKSSVPHAAIATGALAQTGVIESTRPLYAFAANSLGSTVNYSKKRLSFLAVTTGLSSSDSATLYSLVQALRTSLGGGFV